MPAQVKRSFDLCKSLRLPAEMARTSSRKKAAEATDKETNADVVDVVEALASRLVQLGKRKWKARAHAARLPP